MQTPQLCKRMLPDTTSGPRVSSDSGLFMAQIGEERMPSECLHA